MLAWMQPHGCLAPRDFSVSFNNLTNVKITTVYRRRENTTQNTLENKIKVYYNTNPVFSSSLAHWFQTSVFLLSLCLIDSCNCALLKQQCTYRNWLHLRLIDMCGLFMLKIYIFFLNSVCEAYIQVRSIVRK